MFVRLTCFWLKYSCKYIILTAYSNGKKENEILYYISVDYSRLTLDYGVSLCSARFLLKHMEWKLVTSCFLFFNIVLL